MTKMVIFPTTITHRDATYTLPVSTRVDLSSPGVHSNPNHWPQPRLFSPDRFLSAAPNAHDLTLPASLNPPLVQDSTHIPFSRKGTALQPHRHLHEGGVRLKFLRHGGEDQQYFHP